MDFPERMAGSEKTFSKWTKPKEKLINLRSKGKQINKQPSLYHTAQVR